MSSDGYADGDRHRWVREDPAQKSGDRDDFARDRARLVHSASLRRLSAKTQVVRPGSSDFVRNRLTHSLEVAQIGRELGGALGCNADVVDTACLAHDLGHPPFGHNGESALDEIAADVGGFEGNAQTFRLLVRLEAKRFHPGTDRSAGLNLTRASLDAATKYPWSRGDGPVVTRKFGVYADDLDAFAWVREGAPVGHRCLEAQTMDWADDVAYSVHDVEDAIASGGLDVRELHAGQAVGQVLPIARERYAPDLETGVLEAAYWRLVTPHLVPESFDGGSRRDLARLKDLTSRLVGRFAGAAEQATRQRYGAGPLTRYAATLVVPEDVRAEVAVLKAVAAHFVMETRARVDLMAEEREIVHGLVRAYQQDPEGRLDRELWADHLAARDDGERLRVVVDQVASLTDARAVALHAAWC
ncbi:deoxyguanosinetriphosphate triphosphohydrolase [Arsenicicoccus dermatophilus]|uniref:deoxyguanosinetriphosphate triphosphohydrolase n=1 Tax=Arsenicicoccus dermatophilus TaxID=1076331 RepID=UPI001F4D3256|nr:deoxyguanosinetriphosphate triphosphohydrolase [Arsenicicoccus dermatophilus]MCH8612768.1 deoxyguanosinetriphosphate triphosphohydrolase [Arsenicicoccus dermatophilus]